VGFSSTETGFYITAFQSLGSGNTNYLLLGLGIIYLITLTANCLLLTLCMIDPSLHNPKYVAVCNLAVVDISMNSVIIPQMVRIFVFNLNHVSFGMCFTQMFFMHFFGDLETFSLALLAYDRFIAICWPLRYSAILTNTRMVLILAGIWLLVFLLEVFPVTLASKLPYCGSRMVKSCCCEHGPVYVLACGDTSYNRLLATAKTLSVLFSSLTFIILSYVVVVVAVLKIASSTQRSKAFFTCLTHSILVLVYYLPVILAYILPRLNVIRSPDVLTAVLTVSVTMPPMLNPIIYSLRTEELQIKIMKLLKRQKLSSA
uniref:Olfactory receptor n=1 Tax=Denticeps clupeoides TaxID=299321 RepID=A0AAY4E3S4_9TELE